MQSRSFESLVEVMRWRRDVEQGDLVKRRVDLDKFGDIFPMPDDVESTSVDLGNVPGHRISVAGVDVDRVLFYLHGGGYALGSIRSHGRLVADLARACGATGLVVDYRLAPEHRFPAALDDALDAYQGLLADGTDPRQLVVAGDSAGGGLTVALLMKLRDRGLPLPAAAVCISPWVDLTSTAASLRTHAERDPLITQKRLEEFADLYLGETDRRHPLASPLFGDLSGLPPLLIQVGTSETLLDDAVNLAARAEAAGVDVSLETWKDMIHVWHLFAAIQPKATEAIANIGTFVRRHLN